MKHNVCPGETTISESAMTMLMSSGRSNRTMDKHIEVFELFMALGYISNVGTQKCTPFTHNLGIIDHDIQVTPMAVLVTCL